MRGFLVALRALAHRRSLSDFAELDKKLNKNKHTHKVVSVTMRALESTATEVLQPEAMKVSAPGVRD